MATNNRWKLPTPQQRSTQRQNRKNSGVQPTLTPGPFGQNVKQRKGPAVKPEARSPPSKVESAQLLQTVEQSRPDRQISKSMDVSGDRFMGLSFQAVTTPKSSSSSPKSPNKPFRSTPKTPGSNRSIMTTTDTSEDRFLPVEPYFTQTDTSVPTDRVRQALQPFFPLDVPTPKAKLFDFPSPKSLNKPFRPTTPKTTESIRSMTTTADSEDRFRPVVEHLFQQAATPKSAGGFPQNPKKPFRPTTPKAFDSPPVTILTHPPRQHAKAREESYADRFLPELENTASPKSKTPFRRTTPKKSNPESRTTVWKSNDAPMTPKFPKTPGSNRSTGDTEYFFKSGGPYFPDPHDEESDFPSDHIRAPLPGAFAPTDFPFKAYEDLHFMPKGMPASEDFEAPSVDLPHQMLPDELEEIAVEHQPVLEETGLDEETHPRETYLARKEVPSFDENQSQKSTVFDDQPANPADYFIHVPNLLDLPSAQSDVKVGFAFDRPDCFRRFEEFHQEFLDPAISIGTPFPPFDFPEEPGALRDYFLWVTADRDGRSPPSNEVAGDILTNEVEANNAILGAIHQQLWSDVIWSDMPSLPMIE